MPLVFSYAKLLSPTKINVTQKIIVHRSQANEVTVEKMRSTFIYVAIVKWLGLAWLGYGCDDKIDLQQKRRKNASAFGHFLSSFFEPRARKYKTNLTVLAWISATDTRPQKIAKQTQSDNKKKLKKKKKNSQLNAEQSQQLR